MHFRGEDLKSTEMAVVQTHDNNVAQVENKEQAAALGPSATHHESQPTELIEQEAPGFSTSVVLAMFALATQGNAYEMTLLIPSTTLSYINADLGPNPSYTWISVSWTLGAAILVSVSGRLSDIFGRRYFMLFGSFVSFIGTIVGATGASISQMILSGVLFGIGSGIQEMVYSCLLEIVPKKHRILAIGIQATSTLPSLCTPLISYAFIAHTSIGWRGAYWFMTAWHGFGFIAVFLFYHPPTFSRKHRGEAVSKLKLLGEMDFIGLLIFIAGCVLFLVGVNFGGRQYPWQSAQVIAPMVTGITLMILLAFWEIYADLKYPLFPPRLFRHIRSFVLVLTVSFVAGMMYYSIQVLWPRQSGLLFAPPDNPILRGAYANITSFGTWVTALSLIFFCSRVGHERWQLVGFLCVNTAFVGSMASVGINDKSQAIASVFLVSCTINQPLFVAIAMLSLAIDDQVDIGIGLGVSSTIRLLGGAIATAIYTAILSEVFTSRLPSEVTRSIAGSSFDAKNLPGLIEAAASGNTTALKGVPGVTPAILAKVETAVKLAYVHGYQIVYLSAVAFGAVALGCSFFTRSIDRTAKTSDAAVLLENAEEKARER